MDEHAPYYLLSENANSIKSIPGEGSPTCWVELIYVAGASRPRGNARQLRNAVGRKSPPLLDSGFQFGVSCLGDASLGPSAQSTGPTGEHYSLRAHAPRRTTRTSDCSAWAPHQCPSHDPPARPFLMGRWWATWAVPLGVQQPAGTDARSHVGRV